MGKIYKNKRRSCALCKPHKRGWADKRKERQRFLQQQDEEEIRETLKPGIDDFWDDYVDDCFDSDYRSLRDRILEADALYDGDDFVPALAYDILDDLEFRIDNCEFFTIKPEDA